MKNTRSDADAPGDEVARIRAVYSARDRGGAPDRYAWWRPAARLQLAQRDFAVARQLRESLGTDLTQLTALDVGCGTGSFLRTLAEWGANPSQLVGSELLADRLETARLLGPPGVHWHLGPIGSLPEQPQFKLVSALTVFSSVVSPGVRAALAEQMWMRVAPGGCLLVFDLRYDNPSNSDVCRVSRTEMSRWWPHGRHRYRTVLLAPPVLRMLAPVSPTAAWLLHGLVPLLRSHFVLTVKKAASHD